jgi:broad specificity phosphatase PhoE
LIAEPLGLPVVIEEGVIEADIGRWTDLSWPEIEQRWPEEHHAFQEDPEQHGYPDGENLGQVKDRSLAAIEKLVRQHTDETFLVVSHGVVNRVLLAHWTGTPFRHARRIPQDNAAFNIVEFQESALNVVKLNASMHLAGLVRPAA